MTKLSTRESQPQRGEQPLPRHRNVYHYDGEYEFVVARHWTARETLSNTASAVSRVFSVELAADPGRWP